MRNASDGGYFAFRRLRPFRVFFIVTFVTTIMMMNTIMFMDSSTGNLTSRETKSESIVEDGTVPPPRNDAPHGEWMYEPVSLSSFWRLPDRRFTSELYPPLGKFGRVLDVGARGYNRECKRLINSPTTRYYQVEPFPPDVMNNDGLLKCKVQEVPKFYPQYESFFDVALDFGVFGWGETRTQFNTTEDALNDISDYIDGILFLLKPTGLWILHTHGEKWVPDKNVVFDTFVLPHFDMGSFEGHASGVGVKNNQYHYYFFYRREGWGVKH